MSVAAIRDRALRALAIALIGGSVVAVPSAAAVTSPGTCVPVVVDFAGLPHGTILGEQLAGHGIHMSAVANEGRPNTLIVFDSNRSGTPDPDLEADLGNLAIIPETIEDANSDGLVDRPSDSIRGGTQIYTFDSERTVKSFVIVDIDHGVPSSHYATAYDAVGNVIVKVPIVIGADGNVQTVNVNADGVRRLEITYRDSAGVTAIDLGCPPVGGEGCTPGYWKQPHHFDSWTPPYDPDDLFAAHFEDAFPGMTMVQVLGQGGGGLSALGRHTVAALLNAASPDVDFAFTTTQVISMFNAVHPGTAAQYEALKDVFEAENERGCDLN